MRRLVSVLAALVVLTLGLPAAAEASTGTILLQGTVLDSNGSPVQANVYLFVSPEVTAETQLPLVGSSSTDANGHFAITSTDTSWLAPYGTDNNGWIGFWAAAETPAGAYLGQRYLSLQFDSTGNLLTYGAEEDRQGDDGDIPATAGAPSDVLTVDSGTQQPSIDGGGCGPPYKIPVGNPWKAWTVIGEVHAVGDTTHEEFDYGKYADSSISVATSVSGTGGWSLSGNYHVGTYGGTTVGVSRSSGNYSHLMLSEFQYQEYADYICGQFLNYEVDPYKWQADWQVGADVGYLDHNCNPSSLDTGNYGPDGKFDRVSHSYTWFDAAATFTIPGTGVAISVNAHSGLSTDVEWHLHFGSNYQNHYLCGTDGTPGDAHRIYAGS